MKIVKDYFRQVYNKAHRESKKKKKAGEVKEEPRESIRCLNKKWRLTSNHDTLFNIGRDMDSLSGKEKLFYTDQLTEREGRLSEEIDEEHETEKQMQRDDLAEQQRVEREEAEFVYGDIDDEMNCDVEDPDNEYMDSMTLLHQVILIISGQVDLDLYECWTMELMCHTNWCCYAWSFQITKEFENFNRRDQNNMLEIVISMWFITGNDTDGC